MSYLAPGLAILAAFLFGISVHLQRRASTDVDGLTGTLIAVVTAALLFWCIGVFVVEWHWFGTKATLIFALVGLIYPASSQFMQITALKRVGPALTSALGSISPLFAVVPAVIFLGEYVSLQGALGIALMVTGLMLAAVAPKAFRGGWPIWALLLPLGASFTRGIVQPITKSGYGILPNPVFATLIMASVSSCVIFLFWMRPKAVAARAYTGAGLTWFVMAGLMNAIGILAIFAAINLADVAIVAPLVSTSPLFVLLLGALIFRNEILRPRHYIVVALTVIGAILLVSQ